MRRSSVHGLIVLLLLITLFIVRPSEVAAANSSAQLEKGFLHFPDTARPWVYWFWQNGSINKEGIAADLEAMKQIGIGGALIMNVDIKMPAGPVRFNSPQWHELFKYAVEEAGKLGLQITMANADGFSGSGGPWIKPEDAMMSVVWSEAIVEGPKKIDMQLKQGLSQCGIYKDIAVFGIPADDDGRIVIDKTSCSYSSNVTDINLSNLFDDNPRTVAHFPISEPNEGSYVTVKFNEPKTIRTIEFTAAPGEFRLNPMDIQLQVMDSKSDFVPAVQLIGAAEPAMRFQMPKTFTLTFDPVEASCLRIVFKNIILPTDFAEIKFYSTSRINNWEFKSAHLWRPEHGGGAQYVDWQKARSLSNASADRKIVGAVASDRIINLTGFMDKSGRLKWEAPAGKWKILRVGYGPTGEKSGFSPTKEGNGLECNKLDPRGVEANFNGFMAKLIKEVDGLAGKTLAYSHIDSWEYGHQNWTDGFRDEFKKRRGYNPTPYLPVMAGGLIVDNVEVSDRFLWDLRRTISDMMTENYWQKMAELCHQSGIKFQAEASGRQQFLYDPISFQSKADLPMGEFWYANHPRVDCKVASSVAHVFGKPYAGAEAYTAERSMWQEDPYGLKVLGDQAFCYGINRFVFHRYQMQPWLDKAPGMAFGPWGIHFERTNTWWKQGSEWVSYLSRSQFMLQQGLFVADILYLPGESAPAYLGYRHEIHPAIPDGYDFDGCNAEVILRQVDIKKGIINLPSGMKYRLLLMPDSNVMTPAILKKVAQFVKDGAVVVGPRPCSSPSMENYPACDKEVAKLAAKVWGNDSGKIKHKYGKGRVYWGYSFNEIFSDLGISPDFEYQSGDKAAKLTYIHRQSCDADFYFVASSSEKWLTANCSFRVTGKMPELWDPKTGQIEPQAIYEQKNGRIDMPIQFEPRGSYFVVFRKAAVKHPVVAVKRDGQTILSAETANQSKEGCDIDFKLLQQGSSIVAQTCSKGQYELVRANGKAACFEVKEIAAPLAIEGPWQISFAPNLGAPPSATFDKLMSWTDSEIEGIKYFSGTATYRKEFDVPEKMPGQNQALYLDLGNVKNFSEVTVNGTKYACLWKPPFCVDITASVHPGKNRLEVSVTNLWPNRLIGDEQFPPDCTYVDRGRLGLLFDKWPQWLLDGKPRPEPRRIAFTAFKAYNKDSKLFESGLLGPVVLRTCSIQTVK